MSASEETARALAEELAVKFSTPHEEYVSIITAALLAYGKRVGDERYLAGVDTSDAMRRGLREELTAVRAEVATAERLLGEAVERSERLKRLLTRTAQAAANNALRVVTADDMLAEPPPLRRRAAERGRPHHQSDRRAMSNDNRILTDAIYQRERAYSEAIDRLRELASGSALSEDEVSGLVVALREAIELVRCCRRLVAGRTVLEIHKALGAPGDFGYETPIGDALQRLYSGYSVRDQSSASPPTEGGAAPTGCVCPLPRVACPRCESFYCHACAVAAGPTEG